jgi:hypothetical protein
MNDTTVSIVSVLAGVSFLCVACVSKARPEERRHMIYAGYAGEKVSFNPVDGYLSGAGIGWETQIADGKGTLYFEGQHTRSSQEELSMLSLVAGARLPIVRTSRVRVSVQGDLGYSRARLKRFRNANQLAPLAAGVRMDLRIIPQVSVNGTVAGRVFEDVTAPTTCNDGSTSRSTGQGTCSHHGGIDHYNDQIGSGHGLELVLGVSFWFGSALEN